MRTVLKGTAGSPYTLQPSDLPVDLDLTFSHWEYVDFSGFDLSAYDCREMDWINCRGDNAVLPARISGLYSRNTRLLNAGIPASLPIWRMIDPLVELFRQRGLALTGANRTMARYMMEFLRDPATGVIDYDPFWCNLFYDIVHVKGIPYNTARSRASTVLAPYPKWLDHMLFVLDLPIPTTFTPPPVRDDGGHISVLTRDGWVEHDFRVDLAGRTDRVQVAMFVAQRLSNLRGEPYYTHVTQIEPYPIVEAVSARRIDGSPRSFWWRHTYQQWGKVLDLD